MSALHHPRAKLSRLQVEAIRLSPALPLRVIAATFNVSRSQVSLIKRGLAWKEGRT